MPWLRSPNSHYNKTKITNNITINSFKTITNKKQTIPKSHTSLSSFFPAHISIWQIHFLILTHSLVKHTLGQSMSSLTTLTTTTASYMRMIHWMIKSLSVCIYFCHFWANSIAYTIRPGLCALTFLAFPILPILLCLFASTVLCQNIAQKHFAKSHIFCLISKSLNLRSNSWFNLWFVSLWLWSM